MSNFDKLVAKWTYKKLDNPKETERQQREKEEEEQRKAKAAEEEEQQHKEEEDKNLPPRPPAQSKKKKAPGKKTGKKIAAAEPPQAEKPRKGSAIKMKVKDVDFNFEKDVQKSLEELEKGNGAKSNSESQKSQKPPPLTTVQEEEKKEEDEEKEEEMRTFEPESSPENEPVDQGQSEEHEKLAAFKFGATTRDSDEDSDDESENADGEENDAPEAEQGNEMPVFLDDKEDERRRTIYQNRGAGTRGSVFDSAYNPDGEDFPAETPKSKDNSKLLSRILERHFLFSFLDDADIAKLVALMEVESFSNGVEICSKGELNDAFYIILKGQVESDAPGDQGKMTLTKGETFNDIALLYPTTCDTVVTALVPEEEGESGEVQCALLRRRTYKVIVHRAMEERRQRYEGLLQRVPYLTALTNDERSRLAETLKQGSYAKGNKIIARGSRGDWIHIIVEGEANVIGENGELIIVLREGDCAGHIEFLYGHYTVADVVAASDTVVTAKLGRRMFNRLIGKGREALLKEVENNENNTNGGAEEDPVAAAPEEGLPKQKSGKYDYYHAVMRSESRPMEDSNPNFDEPPSYVKQTLEEKELDVVNSIRLSEEEAKQI